MSGVEDINRWAVIVTARRVTQIWENLQSARLAAQCYPDDPIVTQAVCDLEVDLGLALEELARFFSNPQVLQANMAIVTRCPCPPWLLLIRSV